MATREFNGVSDYIVLGGTGTSIGDNAWSLVTVIKPLVLASSGTYVSCARTTSNSPVFELADGSTSGVLAHNNYSDGTVSASTGYTATDWQLCGVSKPAGSGDVTARFHAKILGSGTWNHDDATVGIGGHPTDAWTLTNIGRRGTGTNFKNFRIAVAAVFNSYLSDANFEAMGNAASTQAIADNSPLALWEFNQASTATTVTDLIGTANETSKSGTTAASDNPAWTYGLAVGGGTSAAQRMLLLGVG